tara:strand:- start:14 stop:655 length:642 start_codon:yes stop_codon:yes gene_type:complete
MKKDELPKKIPIFPLSNFIIFPHTTVPLNIFEPRYIEMVNDSMKTNKLIGMIQPKNNKVPSINDLHNVGCLGKITSFKETDDNRYEVILTGLSRFKVAKEIKNNKLYRECQITFNDYEGDIKTNKEKPSVTKLDTIFKDLKTLFKKKGYLINWNTLEQQNPLETINTLAMISPFSVEEKQVLLETTNFENRTQKISEILNNYAFDDFDNSTVQ